MSTIVTTLPLSSFIGLQLSALDLRCLSIDSNILDEVVLYVFPLLRW